MNDSLRLLGQVRHAGHVDELRSLRDQASKQLHEQIRTLQPGRQVERFNEWLNELHDAVIQRTIILSESELARTGMGSPPVPYSYILFGSGGRKEQTLSSDQDSGIIYEDPQADDRETAQYFVRLGKQIVQNLQKAGYPPCEGNVMSGNSAWCLSVSDWSNRLETWFEQRDWEAVRYLLIVADSRSVYGDASLVEAMKGFFFQNKLKQPLIRRRMIENTMRHKMLVGIFGQLLKEPYGEDAGSVDIKYGAYIPMVNSIRMMAIEANIKETETLKRLVRLVEVGKLDKDEQWMYSQAFRIIIWLRLMATEQKENDMYWNNGMLNSKLLTKEMIEQLKYSLRAGKKLQRAVYKQAAGKLK